MNSLQYLTLPYPKHINNIISDLPRIFQDLAYQERTLSLEMIIYLANFFNNANYSVANSASTSKTHGVGETGHHYNSLSELGSILDGLNPRSAPLERIFCIANYLLLTSSYYHYIAQRTHVFQSLRAEATDLVLKYQPRGEAERMCFIFHGMLIVRTWITTKNALEEQGLSLLDNLKHRFSEVRHWEKFEVVMQMYPLVPPARVEWKKCWLQSRPD